VLEPHGGEAIASWLVEPAHFEQHADREQRHRRLAGPQQADRGAGERRHEREQLEPDEASLAMPTQRTTGLGPVVRLRPAETAATPKLALTLL